MKQSNTSKEDSAGMAAYVWDSGWFGKSEPGILQLNGDRLTFTKENGVAFDAPIRELDISYPWYCMGMGFRVKRDGNTYRVSFVPPKGTRGASGRIARARMVGGVAGAGMALTGAAENAVVIVRSRREFAPWREQLDRHAR